MAGEIRHGVDKTRPPRSVTDNPKYAITACSPLVVAVRVLTAVQQTLLRQPPSPAGRTILYFDVSKGTRLPRQTG